MAEQNLGTYSAEEVQVILEQESTGLVYRVVGFMEDSMVTITPSVDTYTPYNGADNTGAHPNPSSMQTNSTCIRPELTDPPIIYPEVPTVVRVLPTRYTH